MKKSVADQVGLLQLQETSQTPQIEIAQLEVDIANQAESQVPSEDAEGTEREVVSRRERKKLEQMEIQAILEEEGVLDELEGKQADELEKLTGNPVAEDHLLYAIPVCGPYTSMQVCMIPYFTTAIFLKIYTSTFYRE
jgi:hypothetical protein